MPADSETTARRSLLDLLRDAHLKRVGGALEYETGGRRRRILLRSGAIVVPAESPLAEGIREASAGRSVGVWEAIFGRLAEHYLAEGVPQWAEIRNLDRLPAGATGPIPTGALLRRCFAMAMARGGGPAAPAPDVALVADAPANRERAEPALWSPEEAWILERLRQVMTFAELRRQCPFPAERLASVVGGLRALGWVRSPDEASAFRHDTGLLKLGELLRARIGASLRERPLGLLDDALQRQLEAMLQRLSTKTHYELLGIPPEADEERVRSAFETLARRIHPSHAERPGIRISRTDLAVLFDRAVAAIRTLGDPVLRAEYDAMHGVVRSVEDQESDDRRHEIQELARREFDRARYEELNGDLHNALVLYERAATLAPRAEYWTALARLQGRNPAWSGRAVESYRRALELDPRAGAEIHYAVGQVLERAGKVEEAVSYYQAAARAEPGRGEAEKALRRLAASGHATEPESGGLGRLFRRR